MFAAAYSDQQVNTLFIVTIFLVAAPLVLGVAALLGIIHRASRPVG